MQMRDKTLSAKKYLQILQNTTNARNNIGYTILKAKKYLMIAVIVSVACKQTYCSERDLEN
jgi:hypothetical protein